MRKHGKIIEYALSSLLRRKFRCLAILAAYALTVAILASILFMTGSLKIEARNLLGSSADLIVQHEELKNACSASIAGLGTGRTSGSPIECRTHPRRNDTEPNEFFIVRVIGLLAVRTDLPQQPLR